MTKKLIGTGQLGLHKIKVYSGFQAGGRGDAIDKEIHINANFTRFEDVVEMLVHESFELACVFHSARYAIPHHDYRPSNVLFSFNHEVFSVICEDVASFLVDIIPLAKKVWSGRTR